MELERHAFIEMSEIDLNAVTTAATSSSATSSLSSSSFEKSDSFKKKIKPIIKDSEDEENLEAKIEETSLSESIDYNVAPVATSKKILTEEEQEQQGNALIHYAVRAGHIDIVAFLLENKVDPNTANPSGNTALHFACQFNQPITALMLINFGCRLDLKNSRQETPIHLAARFGSCEVVRTLMLHGAKIEKTDKDGYRPADLAKDPNVVKLFSQYRQIINTGSGQNKKFELRKQLAPSERPLARLKISVLGNSGVGKTTLIESLKCEATTALNDPMGGFKLDSNNNANVQNYNHTKGVNIQKTTISDVGEVMFLDFSGLESYYDQYSLFLGDSSCAHIIVLSLNDSESVRNKQVDFWLEFIRVRMSPKEPIGFAGCNMWAPNIFIVLTNPNESNCSKNEKGEWYLKTESTFFSTLLEKFERDVIINQPLFILDAQLPSSNEMKELKKILAKLKDYIGNFLPTRIGCLEQTLLEFPAFVQDHISFPVVWFKEFADFVREKVNLFASDENIRELLVQMQLMGEVICFGSEPQDMVVLNPNWLGTEIIGRLLSREHLQACNTWSGFLQVPFLESIFQKMDVPKITKLLKSLDVAFDRTVNNNVEYYVHAYNKTDFKSMADDIVEVKRSAPLKCSIKIATPQPINNQFQYILSHVLVSLHRILQSEKSEFSQWMNACRVHDSGKTAIIELENSKFSTGFIVHCYSNDSDAMKLFAFCETICAIIFSSVDQQCPGLFLQRLPASWVDSSANNPHQSNISFYKAESILTNVFKNQSDTVKIDELSKEERLVDVLAFGSQETFDKLQLGIDAHISCLSYYTRCQIAWLLDKDIDLCKILAELLKIDEKVVPIEPGTVSIFDRFMSYWNYIPDMTVRKFCEALEDADYGKYVELVLKLTPIFVYGPIPPDQFNNPNLKSDERPLSQSLVEGEE
ncbi:hypothetical protein HELRODRAFT_194061 [Helobdella robusta]|uniref:Roc domain-containing protein n=1 Tax=Helobdella robusta TaxID=6412 RepID=T1FVM8_HELRO|nr:hypothetical protein HELRODRAFT_194061 [Helobdella robusta]ESN93543.1 hypothetical protein HELRODRAFT_194061 [Helobdella robusta]